MNIKNLTTITSALLLSVFMMPTAFAHDGEHVSDSSGNPVRDSSGKCVKAGPGNRLEGCGTPAPVVVEVAPVPVAVPTPKPRPVMVPKPRPVIVRAPAPKVHILNLNESGGSNFATASAKLSAKARHQLTSFANTVMASNVSPSTITIIGHTDSRGSTSYNQNLSVERAQSVANFLTGQGMNRGVMHIGGKGESQPVASNDTKAGRAANRRVAIAVKGQRRVMGR